MILKPMDVLSAYPVRKSKKQKKAFREDVTSYLKTIGYDPFEEKGSMGSRNLIFGNPEEAEYLVTAHYDTPARLPFPNLITPCNAVTFILYQMLVVVLYIVASIAVGVACGLLTNSPETAGAGSLIVYWILLIMMLAGPANPRNANDNTSGVVSVLEIAKSMPEASRGKVCFVLFDLEEAGLIGSAAYRKAHKKASENQIVLNMDCVGDGNELMFFPTKKLRRDENRMNQLRSVCGVWGGKSIGIREKGFAYYPSDQKNFPYGVGIAAFRRSKWAGLYCSRIHTHKDTILEETNVNILRAAIVSLISCRAVNEERKMKNETV